MFDFLRVRNFEYDKARLITGYLKQYKCN
jgi:hypothetical protein